MDGIETLAVLGLPVLAGAGAYAVRQVQAQAARRQRQALQDRRDHEARMAAIQVEAIRASNAPQYPSLHTLTYSPHQTGVDRRPDPELPAPPAVFQPDPLGTLALRGLFRGGQYLYGFTPTGQPVQLPQGEGRSLGIFGQGGSGGTTALLAAALQELMMPFYLPGQQEPARLIVVDYHARKPESLTQRIAGTPLADRLLLHAHTPAEVSRATTLFQRTNRARVDGAPAPWPCVLVCDEIGNLVDDPDYEAEIPPLLAAFKHANNAYRAVGGKAIVRAHTVARSAWHDDATVRQSFHVRLGMRLDEAAGVLLGLRPAVARTLLALGKGQGHVAGPGLPWTQIITPLVEDQDIAMVCDLAARQHKARTIVPLSASRGPVADQSRTSRGNDATDEKSVPATDDIMARHAAELFFSGQPMIDAIEQAFGVSRKNPNLFGPARTRLETYLRYMPQKGATNE